LIAIGTMLYSLNGSVKSIEMRMTLQTSMAQPIPPQAMPPALQPPPSLCGNVFPVRIRERPDRVRRHGRRHGKLT
jgi:hypothetical protein